jgi:hypothetical protein
MVVVAVGQVSRKADLVVLPEQALTDSGAPVVPKRTADKWTNRHKATRRHLFRQANKLVGSSLV